MEIGRSKGDITETGKLKNVTILLDSGHIKTPQVDLGRIPPLGEVVRHDSKCLEHISANAHALMTSHTTIGFKEIVAFPFFGAQNIRLATKESVKARIRRG